MAIAFVQTLGGGSLATSQSDSVTLGPGVSTTQGNTVIVRAHSTAGNNVVSIRDSQGNVYLPAQPSIANNATAEIWYGYMQTPLVPGNTITAIFESSQAATIIAADEFSGIDFSTPVDQTAENSSAAATVTVGPTGLLGQGGELAVTCGGGSAAAGTFTFPGGSWTSFANPGGMLPMQGAWQIPVGTGALSATWGQAGSTHMEAVIATFQAAPGISLSLFPIPIVVELLIAGAWVDISGYWYQRDGLQITGGKSDATTTSPDPATLTITLNNRDGRFSPLNINGAYYPNLTRNQQIRVSIRNAQSSSGNVYSGYRFWGSISDWPPLQDISGHDVYVTLTASGPLRQIKTGGGTGSALTRYYQTLTGPFAPIAYWPCEEDPDSHIIGAGIDGGSNMAITTTTVPKWKAIKNFDGSTPIPIINHSTWQGQTLSLGGSGNDVFSEPGTFNWIAPVSTVDVRCTGGGGGGENGIGNHNGTGGGGGELARESALTVVPGRLYLVTVGAGGQGGALSSHQHPGVAGMQTTFTDTVTGTVLVTAHGGSGGNSAGGGRGGSGSVNSSHFSGGAGGSNPGNNHSGAGGGGSGGTSSAGNNGANSPSGGNGSGGAGGAAVAGGGAGGQGGPSQPMSPNAGFNGGSPGGGGGGGGFAPIDDVGHSGGAGAPGQVQLVYTPPAVITTVNVIRFIMMVPAHGGNPGAVIMRINTGSAVLDHLDVTYATVNGKLRLQGFNSSNVQQFDSTAMSWALDGQPVMVSIELQNSGTAIAWAFRAVYPGNTQLQTSATGTLAAAQVGAVSTITVDPNTDVFSTALGHISVQYALIPLIQVSDALAGHTSEMSVDRFIRLANEQVIDQNVEFAETGDHWGFEDAASTATWSGANGTVSQSNTTIVGQWPTDGTNSLLLTASGAGQPSAVSPTGLNAQPVNGGDIVSVAAEIMAPTALAHAYLGIRWYNSPSGGACTHAEDDTPDTVLVPNTATLFKASFTAPTGAGNIGSAGGFFAVVFGDHNTDAANTQMFLDNVRVCPRMGVQTSKSYHNFLEEIEDLDQGILKEAKDLFGMRYRTRIALTNQSPTVVLHFNQGMVSPPLTPVFDTQNIKNDVTVKRQKGSSIRVTAAQGAMSILEPPAGVGRIKKQLQVAAEADTQLAALAAQLLGFGIASSERYPQITVDLKRASLPGNAIAPIMSAVAGAEIGDMVTIDNLPFWYPAPTTSQLIIGYTETINSHEWIITWNCTPELPYEITSTALRRW